VTLVLRADDKATLRITASVGSDQTDTDPSNDEETITTLATFPNLAVSALDSVKAALPGATITIDETTNNRGAVVAAQSVTRVYFSSDRRLDDPGDTVLYSRNVPVLAPKANDSISNSVALPAVALGRYYLIGVADAAAAVAETRENNKKIKTLIITRPDLKVTALSAPGKAAAGANITITDTTTNKSELDAGASTTRFFLSADAVFDGGDTPLVNNSRPVPALAPKGKDSGTITATIPAGTAPGKYFLIAVADAGGAVTEADETDNVRARKITVGP
jgi:subtilase family serine protease